MVTDKIRGQKMYELMRLCEINFILSELEERHRQQDGEKSKSRNTNYEALAVIRVKGVGGLNYGNISRNGEKWRDLENIVEIEPKRLDDVLDVKG